MYCKTLIQDIPWLYLFSPRAFLDNLIFLIKGFEMQYVYFQDYLLVLIKQFLSLMKDPVIYSAIRFILELLKSSHFNTNSVDGRLGWFCLVARQDVNVSCDVSKSPIDIGQSRRFCLQLLNQFFGGFSIHRCLQSRNVKSSVRSG